MIGCCSVQEASFASNHKCTSAFLTVYVCVYSLDLSLPLPPFLHLTGKWTKCSFYICRANMIHFFEKSYPLTEYCYLSFNKVLLFFLWQNIVIYLLIFLYSTWENVCLFSIRSWSSVFFFCFVLFLRLRVKPFSGCQIVKEETLHFLKFYFTTVWSPWAVRRAGRMIRSLAAGWTSVLGSEVGAQARLGGGDFLRCRVFLLEDRSDLT